MPKKRNFLGGMQNYNPNTGEYESALVGPNGKVAKDVDGDGKEHESQKGNKDYQGTVDKLNKEFGLSAEKGFKLAKTDDPAYSGVNILHPTGRGMTPNELEYALEKGTLKGYEELANQREKAMREGTYKTNKYEDIFDEDYQRSHGPEKFEDENDPEILKSIISKAKELGDENILENAQDRLDQLQQEKTKKSFSKFGKEKIDEEEAPYFKSAKAIDSLWKKTKSSNLSFERMLLNDIKQNPENYNKIVLNDKEYVRKGNSFDVYRNQKLLYSGTFNSVASDINQEYLDVESKMDNSFSNINKKRMGLPF